MLELSYQQVTYFQNPCSSAKWLTQQRLRKKIHMTISLLNHLPPLSRHYRLPSGRRVDNSLPDNFLFYWIGKNSELKQNGKETCVKTDIYRLPDLLMQPMVESQSTCSAFVFLAIGDTDGDKKISLKSSVLNLIPQLQCHIFSVPVQWCFLFSVIPIS